MGCSCLRREGGACRESLTLQPREAEQEPKPREVLVPPGAADTRLWAAAAIPSPNPGVDMGLSGVLELEIARWQHTMTSRRHRKLFLEPAPLRSVLYHASPWCPSCTHPSLTGHTWTNPHRAVKGLASAVLVSSLPAEQHHCPPGGKSCLAQG